MPIKWKSPIYLYLIAEHDIKLAEGQQVKEYSCQYFVSIFRISDDQIWPHCSPASRIYLPLILRDFDQTWGIADHIQYMYNQINWDIA